jgi:cation:H+ antiporter
LPVPCGAVGIAGRLGVSPLIIGLTLVGFGTSTPELVTSVQAALTGSPGIAVGNVVGSNIANILLILGVAAVVAPIAAERAGFLRDGTALVLATALGVVIVLTGSLGRLSGGLLVAALVAYLVTIVVMAKRAGAAPDAEVPTAPQGTGKAALLFLGGLVLTVLGARFLVQGAVTIAEGFGVSEAVIGLTLVALGTSLPELVTSVVAARKGEGGVALGNVLGSNVYNILGILGVTALVRPLTVPPQIASVDVWVMAGATAALLAVVVSGWRVTRVEGAALIVAYAAYIGWLATTI